MVKGIISSCTFAESKGEWLYDVANKEGVTIQRGVPERAIELV